MNKQLNLCCENFCHNLWYQNVCIASQQHLCSCLTQNTCNTLKQKKHTIIMKKRKNCMFIAVLSYL